MQHYTSALLFQRGKQFESTATLATLGGDQLARAIQRRILRLHDLAGEKEGKSGRQQQTAWHRSLHWSVVLTMGANQIPGGVPG